MDQRNLISSLILFLLAVFVLIRSLGLGIGSLNNPQGGFMPFCSSLLIIFFCLILFVMTFRKKTITTRWTDLWRHVQWQKSVLVVAALAVYIALLPWGGYLIATVVLMTVLFGLSSLKIWPALLGGILSVGITYGLFHFLLKTPLPRGIWGF